MDECWVDETLEQQMNDCFSTMLQAAQQPSVYINTERKAFYTGTAKSTIRNKNRQMRLAAQGSAKIDSYFYPVIDLTESKSKILVTLVYSFIVISILT